MAPTGDTQRGRREGGLGSGQGHGRRPGAGTQREGRLVVRGGERSECYGARACFKCSSWCLLVPTRTCVSFWWRQDTSLTAHLTERERVPSPSRCSPVSEYRLGPWRSHAQNRASAQQLTPNIMGGWGPVTWAGIKRKLEQTSAAEELVMVALHIWVLNSLG